MEGACELTTFRASTLLRGLGPASPPGVQHLRWVSLKHPYLTPCLLAQAYEPLRGSTLSPQSSTFGLSCMTAFISSSRVLTIPRDPSPRPLWC
jgi:hypothetical protein